MLNLGGGGFFFHPNWSFTEFVVTSESEFFFGGSLIFSVAKNWKNPWKPLHFQEEAKVGEFCSFQFG